MSTANVFSSLLAQSVKWREGTRGSSSLFYPGKLRCSPTWENKVHSVLVNEIMGRKPLDLLRSK